MVYFYRAHPNPGLLVKMSMGLMLAGAFGNLADRIFRDHVVDFVDVGPFWIFNVADSSITIGLTTLAVSVLLFDQGPAKPGAAVDPEFGHEPEDEPKTVAVGELPDDDPVA